MSKKAQTQEKPTIHVQALSVSTVRINIVGVTPLVCNRMSAKVMQGLLVGGGKKTAAEKAGTSKHNPLREYRDSPYTGDGPTLLKALAAWFKQAMCGASLDVPGMKKTETGRLVQVLGERLDLYGAPQIYMAVTRSADIARTPDIRTRAILPRWATNLTVQFVTPAMSSTSVANLLSTAGITQGVGDGRAAKGKLTYGCFRVASEDDPEFADIVAAGGRAAQEAAMDEPLAYDDETRELLAFFEAETRRRELKVV